MEKSPRAQSDMFFFVQSTVQTPKMLFEIPTIWEAGKRHINDIFTFKWITKIKSGAEHAFTATVSSAHRQILHRNVGKIPPVAEMSNKRRSNECFGLSEHSFIKANKTPTDRRYKQSRKICETGKKTPLFTHASQYGKIKYRDVQTGLLSLTMLSFWPEYKRFASEWQ